MTCMLCIGLPISGGGVMVLGKPPALDLSLSVLLGLKLGGQGNTP